MSSPTPAEPSSRVASLDQFRGYTVAGMIFVNFVGGYVAIPAILKHHNTYCSYADTIMPQFFFAVGFAYRLTYLKREERQGTRAAVKKALARNLALLILGLVFHRLDGGVKSWDELLQLGFAGFVKQAFQRDPFQTLTQIALTSLWCLPVIGAGPAARVAFAVGSAFLHLRLSTDFFFEFAMKRPVIDGGSLSVFSWTIPLLAGSLARDLSIDLNGKKAAIMAAAAVGLMAIGYALSNVGGHAPPPFVAPDRPVDVWMMSQRSGSVSYLTFAAGFSWMVYLAFIVVADVARVRIGFFRTLGQNALVVYLIHALIFSAIKPYTPRDAPLGYVLGALALSTLLIYSVTRHFEKNGILLKL